MLYLWIISGCSKADSTSTMSKMVAITLGRAREQFPLAFIIHNIDDSLFVAENNRILEDLFAEGKKWTNPLWVDHNF